MTYRGFRQFLSEETACLVRPFAGKGFCGATYMDTAFRMRRSYSFKHSSTKLLDRGLHSRYRLIPQEVGM